MVKPTTPKPSVKKQQTKAPLSPQASSRKPSLKTDNNKTTTAEDNKSKSKLEKTEKTGKAEKSEKLQRSQKSENIEIIETIILHVKCGPARVRKLQILSHHYKIAKKLEIYVGSIQRRKEMVGMATNTGITVMGEPVDYLLAGESQKIPIEHVDETLSRVSSPETCMVPVIQDNQWMINNNPNDQRNVASLYSVADPSLSNDFLCNGEETDQLIAAYNRAKQSAVKVEDFHLAKVLKYAIEMVTKAAEDAIKLDALKKQAVEEEDFDNADKFKRELETLRSNVRSALSDEGLELDESGEVVVYDSQLADIVGLADDAEDTIEISGIPGISDFGQNIQNVQSTMMRETTDFPSGREHQYQSLPKSRTNSSSSFGGNRIPRSPIMTPMTSIFPVDQFDDRPDELSELERSAFALSIQYYGEFIVACFLSKKLSLRDEALVDITKRVDIVYGDGKNIEDIDKMGLIKATFQIIQEAMNDNLPIPSTWKLVEHTYDLLFIKITDSNARIKQSATDLFCYLSKTYRSSNYSIISLVLKPAKTTSQALKPAKAKVELAIKLVKEFGISLNQKSNKMDKDLGLNLEIVMQFAISYLNNNNEEVHDYAVILVVEIVKLVGREKIEGFLPDIKPKLLEHIWNLITEWEGITGKIAGHMPSPPPSPKSVVNNALTTEEKQISLEDFTVDANLLNQPLAKRGTVTRIEQQLNELRSLMNNTNNIIKDDYETYIANSTKNISNNETIIIENEEIPSTLPSAQPSRSQTPIPPSAKHTESTNKKPITRGSKTAAATTANSKSTKKLNDNTKTSTSKTSTKSNTTSSTKKGLTEETKKSPRKNSNPAPISDATLCDQPDADRCCIFCDEQNDRFTEENLVTHYWNDCPVLTNCRLCNIVNCDKRKFVKQCPRCREVIDADDFLEHTTKQTCLVIRDDIVRCPLCKTVVKPATEAGWKAHLLDLNGCPKNQVSSNAIVNSNGVSKNNIKLGSGKRPTAKSDSPKVSSTASKTASSRTKLTASSGKDKVKKTTTAKVSKIKK
ncbi:3885_t:CDS:10 [Diversispora eburnea]|uniref:3885_t:CDS:1 n=1 Tax=Diversispora eburnea TaxID=1213867 RepID=A0A9N8Z9M8_9GLOM|nr:3885_t:CDS:10 [Diversispora eburnea]